MTHNPTADAPAPSLQTIARLVEQSIEEQRDNRARFESRLEIAMMQIAGFQKLVDSLRSTTDAQFLTTANELADLKRHVLTIEEHVGLLTTKIVSHDKRFDAHDRRFDGIDRRFDGIDQRFDGIDQRLDDHDERFDAIDARLDRLEVQLTTLADAVGQIHQAVVPRGDSGEA